MTIGIVFIGKDGFDPSPDDMICITDGTEYLPGFEDTIANVQDIYDADVLGFNYFRSKASSKEKYDFKVRTMTGEEAVEARRAGEFPSSTGCVPKRRRPFRMRRRRSRDSGIPARTARCSATLFRPGRRRPG